MPPASISAAHLQPKIGGAADTGWPQPGAMPAHNADCMRILVSGDATGGAYAVGLRISQPGFTSPLHCHSREDEVFHILEGRLRIWCDGRDIDVGPGDTTALPRGLPHSFQVISATPARLLTTLVPGGLENFFAAVAELGPEHQARLIAISRDYGIEYVGSPPEA